MSRRAANTMAAAAASVVIPKSILTGLRVELDPKDVTLNGSLVTQFNNTNGVGGACAQATPANQATFNASDPNFSNQPSVAFSGTSIAGGAKYYTLPDLSSLTQGEVFVVLKCDYSFPGPAMPPSSAYTGLWTIDNAGGGSSIYNGAPSSVSESFGSTARVSFGPTGLNVNVPHIYNVRSASGSYVAYQSMAPSGGLIYSSASNTVGFRAVPSFGRNNNGNGFFNGQLAYLAITDQVQTAAARAQMLNYLANRFGIALP